MANELRLAARMNLVSGSFSYIYNPIAYQPTTEKPFDLIGSPNADSGLLTITTSGTNFTLVNVTTLGYVGITNTDTTNYVDIGYNDAGTLRDLIRLKPGEFCIFRAVPGKTLRGEADTASVVVQYMIFED